MMGRSSAAVKKIIRSIDLNLRWSLAQQELKRCVSDEKSIAHSAFKLNTWCRNQMRMSACTLSNMLTCIRQ